MKHLIAPGDRRILNPERTVTMQATLIPNNTPQAVAQKAVAQRAVERIDRAAVRKALARAQADRDRSLAEHDDAVKQAEEALANSEQRRLERALALAKRNRADAQAVHDGRVKTAVDALTKDCNTDPRFQRHFEAAQRAISREQGGLQSVNFGDNPAKYAAASLRIAKLTECSQQLLACRLEADAIKAIDDLLAKYQVEGN